jgi:hypothetical protein
LGYCYKCCNSRTSGSLCTSGSSGNALDKGASLEDVAKGYAISQSLVRLVVQLAQKQVLVLLAMWLVALLVDFEWQTLEQALTGGLTVAHKPSNAIYFIKFKWNFRTRNNGSK